MLGYETKRWIEITQSLLNNERLNKHIYAKKRRDFKSINELSLYFNYGPAINQVELCWTIFAWIAENITFNRIGVMTKNLRNNDPISVFINGLAVCQGFANLLNEICKLIGLDCITIYGYAKGEQYKIGKIFSETNHVWNAVKLDGYWYYLDSTWSSRRNNLTNELKNLDPHWFMTPPNIFLESHYSEDFQLHKPFTKEEFENLPMNELDYHILGFKNDTIKNWFIKFDTNPFFIEYTSEYDCDLSAELVEEDTGEESNNSVIIQKDSTKRPYKYCLIIMSDKSNKNYILSLFGKKTIDRKKKLFFLTKYVVRRQSDKQVRIPEYNLTFENEQIILLSHRTKLIQFHSNPLVMEFRVPETIKILAELKDYNMNKIENSTLVEKFGPKIYVNVSLPKSRQRFTLSLFSNIASRDKNFLEFSNFELIKRNNNQDFIDMPKNEENFYELGFKSINHYTSKISSSKNPICLEYISDQKCKILPELIKESTGEEIKNSCLIQQDFLFKPYKYCVIVFLKDKNTNYKLNLYGKSEQSHDNMLTIMCSYTLNRSGIEFNKMIPKYNLTFLNNTVKLLSHHCLFIAYHSDPLILEFSAPFYIDFVAELNYSNNAKKIENAVRIHKNQKNNNILVKVSSPVFNQRLTLVLLSNEKGDGYFYSFTTLQIIKTN